MANGTAADGTAANGTAADAAGANGTAAGGTAANATAANGSEASGAAANDTAQNGSAANASQNASAASGNDSDTSVQKPFVTIKTHVNATENTTTVEVQIAMPNQIISVYLLLYVPLAMGWIAFFHAGQPEAWYMVLLPLTLCLMHLGLALVNQSLVALMQAPMAVTAVQATVFCGCAGLWTLASEVRQPLLGRDMLFPLFVWAGVGVMYAAHELLSHVVSFKASLSERTVIMNLAPVVAHLFEGFGFLVGEAKVVSSLQMKMGLALMVLGAVLFSVQAPNINSSGVFWAILLACQVVPFRLMERVAICHFKTLPIPLLACYDACLLAVSSSSISASSRHPVSGPSWQDWLANGSILWMLGLSLPAFAGAHMAELSLLRVNSATTVIVFHNISNIFIVGMGVIFFGEQVLSSPLAIVGVLISLGGGLWYAREMQPKQEPKEEPKEETPMDGYT